MLASRHWLRAGFLLVLFPLLFIAGFLGLFLSSLAGRALGLVETGPSRLPMAQPAIAHTEKVGQGLASLISAASGLRFDWKGFQLKSNGQDRRVQFNFQSAQAPFFAASLEYLEKPESQWAKDGWTLSGDSGDSEKLRPAIEAALRSAPLEDWKWPLAREDENNLLEAGRELAKALRSLPFTPNDCSWEFSEVVLERFPSLLVAHSVTFLYQAREAQNRTSLLWARFQFDGQDYLLSETTAMLSDSSPKEISAIAESAVREWIGEKRGPFRLKKENQRWESCTAQLGEGARLVFEQSSAHPFLAEYYMRISLTSPAGLTRRFVLPMNTGGRTQVLVFEGHIPSGDRALRLTSPPHFDAAFLLDGPCWLFPIPEAEWQFLGAFLQTQRHLAWAAADDPAARQAFLHAREQGYPAAIEAREKSPAPQQKTEGDR